MALSLYRIGWISPPNKKNGAFGGRIYHALIKTYLPSKPVLSLEGFYIYIMEEKTFNALMVKGYDQTLQGDSYPIEDVFEELERGL